MKSKTSFSFKPSSITENGCKWRKLPEHFGLWHTIYVRMNRWSKNNVWPKVLEALQTQLGVALDVTALSLDSTPVSKCIPMERAHPKKGPQKTGKSRGGLTTKIHSVVDDLPILCKLSASQAGDDPQGRILIENLPEYHKNNDIFLLMDRAYEGDKICHLENINGLNPVVPPKSNRKEPRDYGKALYKRQNEAERYFRRPKGFRRDLLAMTNLTRCIPLRHHPRNTAQVV